MDYYILHFQGNIYNCSIYLNDILCNEIPGSLYLLQSFFTSMIAIIIVSFIIMILTPLTRNKKKQNLDILPISLPDSKWSAKSYKNISKSISNVTENQLPTDSPQELKTNLPTELSTKSQGNSSPDLQTIAPSQLEPLSQFSQKIKIEKQNLILHKSLYEQLKILHVTKNDTSNCSDSTLKMVTPVTSPHTTNPISNSKLKILSLRYRQITQ